MGASSLLLFPRSTSQTVESLFVGWTPGNVSFTRTQTSTNVSYFGANGFLNLAASNEPRFEFAPVKQTLSGLLIEPQATNRALYSATPYTKWTLSNGTKSPYGATFGLFNDACVVTSSGANWHRATTPFFTNSGSTSAWELYVIAGTSGKIYIELRASGQSTALYGTIGGTLSVSPQAAGPATYLGTEDLGNGVKRIYGTFTSLYTATATLGIGPYGTQAGESIILFGGQIEDTRSTSFIPTQGTALTRAADQLSFVIPSGITTIRYVFDDNTLQDVAVAAGPYVVPTNLNKTHIKEIRAL